MLHDARKPSAKAESEESASWHRKNVKNSKNATTTPNSTTVSEDSHAAQYKRTQVLLGYCWTPKFKWKRKHLQEG
jgi:hypothetical protein